jgi:hypothetical protein
MNCCACGEVGVVRRQAGEVAQLQATVQNLQDRARSAAGQAGAPTQAAQLAPADQFQLHQMHMVNAMKMLALAMRIYEGDHNDQLPTNLDQLTQSGANYLGAATNGFKFTYVAGVPDVIDGTPQFLSVRERNPRQSPNGQWVRVYAYADGSVRVEYANNGSFDDYEKQYSPPAPSQ